ncbi:T-cell surface glycoprotein CD8 alpha chain [Dromiciops gliroides]|uniref:T-cell surface glycoprotein CD8 alpha chain n=1 Tax=Dromiciops gliroides TaxID=33562 RepID=UPI001CC55CBC|nr:T-cell surface glycoprotein CD8 alpha chain [Dromiciops gliroides]
MGSPSAVRSLLLPLVLLLQPVACQAQGKFRMVPTEKRDAQLGQRIQLSCETLAIAETGCSWLRLPPGARVPTFLLFISGTSTTVRMGDNVDKRLQGGKKSSSIYTLTLTSFREEDEGFYYCVLVRNGLMHFSHFVPVFLPVKATTTSAPKPTTTTLATTTNSSIQNSAGSGKCKPFIKSKEKKGLDFSCDLYIWMPLTGVCVVLLLALITTIIICQRSRRRVCRCPRPLIRPGGKSGPQERYV